MTTGGTVQIQPPGARTERELIQAAMAGDADAFSDLVEVRVNKMFAVARVLLILSRGKVPPLPIISASDMWSMVS